jgi:hypothetical protein
VSTCDASIAEGGVGDVINATSVAIALRTEVHLHQVSSSTGTRNMCSQHFVSRPSTDHIVNHNGHSDIMIAARSRTTILSIGHLRIVNTSKRATIRPIRAELHRSTGFAATGCCRCRAAH